MLRSKPVLGVALSLLLGAQALADGVDTLLTNGRIYTVDAEESWAEALAIREGRIVYVGSNAGAEPPFMPHGIIGLFGLVGRHRYPGGSNKDRRGGQPQIGIVLPAPGGKMAEAEAVAPCIG